MKKNLKDNIYKLIIKSCFAMAFLAAGSASYWGGYQQKEPEHLDEYLKIANEKKIPNIILACTHYPIIRDSIEKRLTYKANIIDPASYASKFLKSDDENLDINIFMSKKTVATENLLGKILDSPYKLTYTEEV